MEKLLLLAVLYSSFAQAGTVVLSKTVQTFKNIDCAKTDSCELKEFSLIDEKKKTIIGGSKSPSHSTDVRFIVKTATVNDLPKFGIVQYIRGCQYNTNANGEKFFGISRHYMDGMIRFQHKEWSIDSDNPDPVYTSWKGKRHSLYRWNHNPASLDPETASYLATKAPPQPVVFATDLPGSFSANGNMASNSSLEFEVCIFKLSDLPLTSTPEGAGIHKEDAIKCFNWESKFTYDFAKRSYKVGGNLAPFCMSNE